MLNKLFYILQQKKFFSMFYLDSKLGLKIRKPRFFLRVLLNYLLIIIFKQRRLRSVDFAPTYACNMNCTHCFALPMLDNRKQVMGLADYRRVASEAKVLGAVHFALQGGEPFLLANLEGIIEAIGPRDCFISITTNGAMLTKERLLKLKKIGLDMLTISIDSGFPQEHDRARNTNGAFDKALEGVRIAQRCNLAVTVNTIITHENIASGGFAEIVKLCSLLKVKLNILYPAVSGRYADKLEVMLSPEEKEIAKAITEGQIFVRRDLDANYLTYGCGALKEMIYISPYGEVMPCAFIHASLGNIKYDSLADCLKKGLRVPHFTRYHPVCPPMEDIDFIRQYIFKISASKDLPADFAEVFN